MIVLFAYSIGKKIVVVEVRTNRKQWNKAILCSPVCIMVLFVPEKKYILFKTNKAMKM